MIAFEEGRCRMQAVQFDTSRVRTYPILRFTFVRACVRACAAPAGCFVCGSSIPDCLKGGEFVD
jgi:hypothetical protein